MLSRFSSIPSPPVGRLWLASASLAVMTLVAASPAKAQNDGDRALEEVVVTALKGDVSVQDAPTTVNVVGGEALAGQAVTSVEQLAAVLPGVRIQQAPGGLVNPVVRGLGSSPSNNSFEQTVGLFVDGIFAGHPRDYSNALFDVERVELLKGTQAAVVGKNTSVGAISLVTKKPDFAFGGEASYFHEFEFGSDIFNAAVNVPLNDRAAIRVAGLVSEEGGWIKNALNGSDEPETSRRAIRATLRLKPNERLDWTLSAQYSETEMDGQLFHFGLDALGNGRRSAVLGGDPGFAVRRYESRWTARPGFNYRGFNGPGSETEGSRFNSTANYDLGNGTLTSVTGYSEYTDTFLIDGVALIHNPVNRGGHETDKTFSQELRYASDWSGKLNVIVGAYYYYDKWSYEDQFDFVATTLTSPLGGAFRNTYTQTTRTASAFGQATFDVTEKFKLTGGLRYEHFEKEGDYSARTVLRPGPLSSAIYGAYPAFKRSGDKDYVDYSVQAQYFWTPDINIYASYATGTKGFGFVANPTAPGGVVTNPFYRTEQSETWEAGVKTTLGDRGSLNLAVFNTEIKDYQIGVNLGANFLIRNDQIRSRGAEINANVKVLEGLTASLVATYAETEKRPPLPTNSIAGLPFAPKWSGIAAVNYTRPLTEDLTFKGELTGEFRSKAYLNDLGNFAYPPSKGRIITNLRLAVASERRGVEVAVVGRNIFDEYTMSYAFNAFGTPGGVQVAEDPPRTIGLQLSLKY